MSISSIKKMNDLIKSGRIESYVLGLATPEEIMEVEEMAISYKEVNEAINQFSEQLENMAVANAVPPPVAVKSMIMAAINCSSGLTLDKISPVPPILHKGSLAKDYEEWLNRPDMETPLYFKDLFIKIISNTAEAQTAIGWIKSATPDEMHSNEYERFLVVEGSCNIVVEGQVNSLMPGDFFSIPLFKSHKVEATSAKPCKVILQRVMA